MTVIARCTVTYDYEAAHDESVYNVTSTVTHDIPLSTFDSANALGSGHAAMRALVKDHLRSVHTAMLLERIGGIRSSRLLAAYKMYCADGEHLHPLEVFRSTGRLSVSFVDGDECIAGPSCFFASFVPVGDLHVLAALNITAWRRSLPSAIALQRTLRGVELVKHAADAAPHWSGFLSAYYTVTTDVVGDVLHGTIGVTRDFFARRT